MQVKFDEVREINKKLESEMRWNVEEKCEVNF